MWSTKGESNGMLPYRSAGAAVLLMTTPIIVHILVHLAVTLKGDVAGYGAALMADPVSAIKDAVQAPSWTAAKIVFWFAVFELILMRVVPGKTVNGPKTVHGYVPVYTANGFQCFVITLVAYLVAVHHFRIIEPRLVYDQLPHIITVLNLSAYGLLAVLYVKYFVAPSGPDCGSSGNIFMDLYWGLELYPIIFGWNVKQFTNCRFGMMGWALLVLSYASAQLAEYGYIADSMLVSVSLQLVYIAKFFWWETGYFNSIDIMHDRTGFYISWGCMVWLPSLYTCASMSMVAHPVHLGLPLALTLWLAGCIAIYVNWDADRQRREFRLADGKLKIWGKPPVMTRAQYKTQDGSTHTNLLLASGYWGISRHFHYVPELAAAFLWCVPSGIQQTLPLWYFFFLCILLTDRAVRDEHRCADKYGAAWKEHCAKVPYRMIPHVF